MVSLKSIQKQIYPDAIATAFKEDDELIIESFLDGTEVSVGVIRYKGEITVFRLQKL